MSKAMRAFQHVRVDTSCQYANSALADARASIRIRLQFHEITVREMQTCYLYAPFAARIKINTLKTNIFERVT